MSYGLSKTPAHNNHSSFLLFPQHLRAAMGRIATATAVTVTAAALLAGHPVLAVHYGDPNTGPGCATDETAIRVAGLTGDM